MNAKATNTPRTFDFVTTYSVPIPDVLPQREVANALPFAQWFSDNEDAAEEGKQPHIFVPHAYWVSRGADADKVDNAYAKGKLRDQFNKWQAKTEKEAAERDPKTKKVTKPAVNPERGHLSITMVGRTGKEGVKGIDEEGVSLWLRDIAAEEKLAAKGGKK